MGCSGEGGEGWGLANIYLTLHVLDNRNFNKIVVFDNYYIKTTTMNIGYDAKRAVYNKTGLGNYSRLLIDMLAKFHPRHRYMLYTPSLPGDVSVMGSLLARGNVHVKQPHSAPLSKSLWRSGSGIVHDASRHHCHVFHGLSGELPRSIGKSKMKAVVTIHDLIFKVHPQYYKFIDRLIYDFKARYACHHAHCIVATSECTKRDIVKFYGIDPSKIEVVYQGCNPRFYEPVTAIDEERVRVRYELPSRYILSVGTIEERKNLMLAVEALQAVDDKHVRLVIVGHRTPYYKKLKAWAKEHGLGHRLYRVSHVSNEDLPALYHMAQLSVYASRYEGFGIPIVESLATGTPVVAATGSCLEEAGGDGAIYVNPDSPEEMARALNSILNSDELRGELVAKGQKHIAQFTGKQFADSMMAIYCSILDK